MPVDAKNDFAVCSPPSSRTSGQTRQQDVLGRSPAPPRRTTTMTMMSATATASSVVLSYRAPRPCRSRRRAVLVAVDAQFYVKVSSASVACIAVTSSNCKVTAAAPRATDAHIHLSVRHQLPTIVSAMNVLTTAFFMFPQASNTLSYRYGSTVL